MTTFPRSPRLLKGGLVLINPETAVVERIITLQYNPETLSRTLQVQGAGGDGGDRSEALRLTGPPVETIKVEIEIDAADLLEKSDTDTVELGIHPQLAVLESIIYPTSEHLLETNRQAQMGTIEIAPAQTPLVLFIWSEKRIVPVRLTEFSVTEEAYDPNLNPLRAKVSLGMRVLNVNDLGFDHKGGNLFMAYQQQKEALAEKNKAAPLSAILPGGLP